MRILATKPNPELVTLPWQLPLEEWPERFVIQLPRGLSRHVVRFVRVGEHTCAVKETDELIARREYHLLRDLQKLGLPTVVPQAVVTGRKDKQGEWLPSALVTRHLKFSLPYRSLFSHGMRADSLPQLVDALVVLLVRLHLTGFFWGDVSLSNTLFRRDAGAFAAYLVDAETGELHERLSNGQREHDLEIARVNIAGELMDLQAGGLLDEEVDAVHLGQRIVERYRPLWDELTAPESFEHGDRWRVDARIRRLNELGFDVGELSISTDIDGASVQIQPKVVDAGHHSRRLLRLTGLDVGENQARRLLNDLDAYRAVSDRQGDSEELVAHDWLTNVFEAVVQAVPREYSRKLEPAEVFHEVLEHRWYLSERRGRDVPLPEVVADYVREVLPGKPDEKAVLGVDTRAIPVIAPPGG